MSDISSVTLKSSDEEQRTERAAEVMAKALNRLQE